MSQLAYCPSCDQLNRIPAAGAQAQSSDAGVAVCGKCKRELPVHRGVMSLNGRELQRLIQKTQRPVIVDYWAPWCGPCRMFAPTFEQAAGQLGEDALLVKLNTEDDPHFASQQRIQSIPTLVKYQGGGERQRVSGALPLPDLLKFVRS